ncbi:MAG: hydrogenase expression protein HypE, partial [Acetobacteraceae bacterium]|nr:hydrogenase expression protein HypE [Acetobacteraceae bacterium]
MNLLDTIPHLERAERHWPWPRASVADEGWHLAIDLLVGGQCTLLGLWGDTGTVHMALLGEASDIVVLSYACKSEAYPSVGAKHAPAIRPERAIRSLFGLEARDAPDTRPWLDLGFWDVCHPLGNQKPTQRVAPYAFLPS